VFTIFEVLESPIHGGNERERSKCKLRHNEPCQKHHSAQIYLLLQYSAGYKVVTYHIPEIGRRREDAKPTNLDSWCAPKSRQRGRPIVKSAVTSVWKPISAIIVTVPWPKSQSTSGPFRFPHFRQRLCICWERVAQCRTDVVYNLTGSGILICVPHASHHVLCSCILSEASALCSTVNLFRQSLGLCGSGFVAPALWLAS
jgi:hypothetical protein